MKYYIDPIELVSCANCGCKSETLKQYKDGLMMFAIKCKCGRCISSSGGWDSVRKAWNYYNSYQIAPKIKHK